MIIITCIYVCVCDTLFTYIHLYLKIKCNNVIIIIDTNNTIQHFYCFRFIFFLKLFYFFFSTKFNTNQFTNVIDFIAYSDNFNTIYF